MGDFNIEVDFTTSGLESSLGGPGGVDSGLGKGSDSGAGEGGSIGKGMLTALKASGIIALLMNLRIIVDLLAGVLAILNLGVIVFLKKMFEFAQDPVRSLLGLGIFIVNAIISMQEKLINLFKPFGADVEFGRFRSDVIDQELDAGTGLLEALSKGFLTEDQYQKQKIGSSLLAGQKQEEAFMEQLKADDARAELARFYTNEVNASLDPALVEGNNAFVQFWKNFTKKMNSMNKEVTGRNLTGISFAQSSQPTALSPSQLLGASNLQSTSISDVDARTYNYLVGLGR